MGLDLPFISLKNPPTQITNNYFIQKQLTRNSPVQIYRRNINTASYNRSLIILFEKPIVNYPPPKFSTTLITTQA